MAGLEARQVLPRLGRRAALLVGASVVTATGLLLVLGGIVLVAERFLGLPKWAGALVVGLVTLGAGAAGIAAALRRLGDPDLAFPETLAELTKDAEALEDGRGRS
jgi:membrane protein implicated in regulation of membrane protease activity